MGKGVRFSNDNWEALQKENGHKRDNSSSQITSETWSKRREDDL